MSSAFRLLGVIAPLLASLGCSAATSTANVDIVGTWGGDNAGLIVNANDVHVHIGCTLGDASGPIRTDATGHFEAAGPTTSTRIQSIAAYFIQRNFPGRSAEIR